MSQFTLWMNREPLAGSDPSGGGVINAPNAVSLAGLAAGVGWVATSNPWLGIASILADELDGHVARETGETSAYGSELDYAIDIALTGAVFLKIGLPWLLPIVVPLQAWLRTNGAAPSFGSARAAGMAYGILKGI